MKNRIFGAILGIFGILIMGVPCKLSGQNRDQTVGYDKNKANYQLNSGDTTNNLHKDYVDQILTKKMKLLQHYLTVLTEKKEARSGKVIDQAMQLFNNDESVLVTVTNNKTKKVFVKPIREYLVDVSKLPYKNIKIAYRNYTTLQNIHKQPDGTFKGLAVLQQEFTGYDKEGNAMYHDVIKRNVEVNIRITDYELFPGDKLSRESVDVFFGNMGVREM